MIGVFKRGVLSFVSQTTTTSPQLHFNSCTADTDKMDTLVGSVNATAKIPHHPFWPLNAALPQYAANTLSSRALVASFVVGASAILGVTLSLIQQSRRKLSKTEMFMTLWFALCGCIHLFFEGLPSPPITWWMIVLMDQATTSSTSSTSPTDNSSSPSSGKNTPSPTHATSHRIPSSSPWKP